MRRAFTVAVLFLACAPAGGAAAPPLATRLARALAVPGYSAAATGAVVVDLATGKTLFARNPDLPLEPASNEKLAVTFAALQELGPSFRFQTEVIGRGRRVGSTWRGDLILKGSGDPMLTSLQIGSLATRIARLGITRVTGRVLGDESWFDRKRTGPDWKASFFLTYCPPLSALIVDRAAYDGHVALQPALAAAGTLRRLLRAHGVTTGPVGLGKAPAAAEALVQVASPPLASVLREMNRESDNLTAELLTKELGAEVGKGGTTADGAAIVRRDLAAGGIPMAGVRIVDGSGLSLADRLTARALSSLLVAMWNTSGWRQTVWASLAVAGVNGTLENRMQHRPARAAVHAKTGTTDEASALSGYVHGRYAFALVENGSPVAIGPAHEAEDAFATVLASAG